MSFHLVTTSDHELRSSIKKNIFLGTWCVPYSEQISSEGKKYIYVSPKSIDKNTLDNDFEKSIKYFDIISKDIFEILNKQNNENYTNRQWTIMLGKFIHEYISVIINRYDNIERAIKNNQISSSTFFNFDNFDLSCKDYTNFNDNCDDHLWNNAIYYKILNYIDNDIQKIILKKEKKRKKRKQEFSIKKFVKKKINFIFKNKILSSKSFISNTYLNRKDELNLLLSFKQPPIFLDNNIRYNNTDFLLRSNLSKLLLKKNKKNLESAIRGIFFHIFPNIYLESYANLKNKMNSSILPKNPNLIFNSNDYVENELFKIYCANKIDNSKYIIGQHGCNYGSARYQTDQIFLLKTVDKFITWGWRENEKTEKGFLFPKLTPIKNRGNKITYMIRFIKHNRTTYDIYHELENEFKNDFDFIDKLNKELVNNLQVKMHPGDGRFYDFQTKLRWQDALPHVKVVNPNTKFDKFKNNSKLFIFNYESTGFLQLININFPTLLILRDFEIQKKDNYKKYYDSLLNSKILHLTNESLVNHLDDIKDNIETWWNSSTTQNDLKNFIKLFANNENSTPENLKNILLKD